MSIQKSVVFLYTSSDHFKNKVKNTTSFTTVSKTMIYLAINLTKMHKACKLIITTL